MTLDYTTFLGMFGNGQAEEILSIVSCEVVLFLIVWMEVLIISSLYLRSRLTQVIVGRVTLASVVQESIKNVQKLKIKMKMNCNLFSDVRRF